MQKSPLSVATLPTFGQSSGTETPPQLRHPFTGQALLLIKMRFLRPRNVRALAGQNPFTIRADVRAAVQSAASPRPVHDRSRSHELSAWQSAHGRAEATAIPRPYSVHDQSGDMTHSIRLNYKPRRSARHFVKRHAQMIQAVSAALVLPKSISDLDASRLDLKSHSFIQGTRYPLPS